MKQLKLLVVLFLSLTFVSSLKLEKVGNTCKDGTQATARILLFSPYGKFMHNRILENSEGQIPMTHYPLKSSSHLTEVTGLLKGSNPTCVTILEAPQVYSPLDIINLAEKILKNNFQKVFIIFEVEEEVNNGDSHLNEFEQEILAEALDFLKSLYENAVLENVYLLSIHNESLTATHLTEPLMSTLSTTFSSSEDLQLDSTNDPCFKFDQKQMNFFSLSGVPWIGHPTWSELDVETEPQFHCYLHAQKFDPTLLSIVDSKSQKLDQEDVNLNITLVQKNLLEITVSLPWQSSEDKFRCVYNGSESSNFFTTYFGSGEDQNKLSQWSEWEKCESFNATTTRSRNLSESTSFFNIPKYNTEQAQEENNIAQLIEENYYQLHGFGYDYDDADYKVNVMEEVMTQTQTRACRCSDLGPQSTERILLLEGFVSSIETNLLEGSRSQNNSGMTFITGNLVGSEQCATIVKQNFNDGTKPILKVKELLRSDLKSFKAIFLTINAQEARLDQRLIDLVNFCGIAFESDLWENVVVVVVTFPLQTQDSNQVYFTDHPVTEESIRKNLQGQLNRIIPVVFFDTKEKVFSANCHHPSGNVNSVKELLAASRRLKPFEYGNHFENAENVISGQPLISHPTEGKVLIDSPDESFIEWKIYTENNATDIYEIWIEDDILIQSKISDFPTEALKKAGLSMRLAVTMTASHLTYIRLYLMIDQDELPKLQRLEIYLSKHNSAADEKTVEVTVIPEWIDSTECTVKCGGGYKIQARIGCMTQNSNLTADCLGNPFKVVQCNKSPCKEFKWGSWEKESICSFSCGGGVQKLKRRCLVGECLGKSSKKISCNEQECPKGYTKVAVAMGEFFSIDITKQLDSIEVFDLNSEKIQCQNLPNFPFGNVNSVGALGFDNNPIICGGLHEGSACHTLKNGLWKPVGSFLEGRRAPAMTRSPFPNDGSILFVTGGENHYQFGSRTSEVLTKNGWKHSIILPVNVVFHCMVLTNSTSVMIIGGYQGYSRMTSSRTFIFNSETNVWTVGPELKQARTTHSCAMIKKDHQSMDKVIIVVGGQVQNTDVRLSSTEILAIGSPAWQRGPELPFGIDDSAIVNDPLGGVVIMRGYSYNEHNEGALLNDVYRLPHAGSEAKWEKLAFHQLKDKTWGPTAFLIPDELTNCTKNN